MRSFKFSQPVTVHPWLELLELGNAKNMQKTGDVSALCKSCNYVQGIFENHVNKLELKYKLYKENRFYFFVL